MPKKSRYKNVNSVSKKQRYMRKHRTSQSQSPDLEVRRGDCSGPRRREQIHLLFFTIFCFQTDDSRSATEAVDSDVNCDEASPDLHGFHDDGFYSQSRPSQEVRFGEGQENQSPTIFNGFKTQRQVLMIWSIFPLIQFPSSN